LTYGERWKRAREGGSKGGREAWKMARESTKDVKNRGNELKDLLEIKDLAYF
jgi:hypothetical protein